ncbi:unnamed protein product [Medioppia subpectinata]|uniref:UBX domain-containing protein n=1 Tax=Medioppia subpectinata TaxID=1979941 RepID=A0A7R9L1Y4_9ACAR|nr:unnamed protein product [Medioppia subpectinata]CAG2112805.1 unnamed protein product [Medioppia subpectinata]
MSGSDEQIDVDMNGLDDHSDRNESTNHCHTSDNISSSGSSSGTGSRRPSLSSTQSDESDNQRHESSPTSGVSSGEGSDAELMVDNMIDSSDLHSSGDTNRFRAEFELKYGSTHPDFFVGTYNQAVDAAKRELRFLLVYLHCESHEDTDQFCRSVIISQRFIDFLTQHNVIFWASSVNYTEGYSVSQQLRESTYPFVALIALKNNRMTVVRKLEAITHLEPLLAQLNASVEHNRSSLLQELREREERNMNQLLRQQQDIDYEQSLAVDRERERLRLEEKARLDAEEEAKRRVELEASERLERMLRLREYLVGELPAEPEPNDPNATHIVIKLPNGPRLERRFLKTECIKYLYYFVYCNKDAPLKFAIRTNFPATNIPGHSPRLEDFTFADDHNRTITSVKTDAPEPTLLDAKLGSRELLLVQDLDA